jgi:hypothetical protein
LQPPGSTTKVQQKLKAAGYELTWSQQHAWSTRSFLRQEIKRLRRNQLSSFHNSGPVVHC